MVRGQIRSSRGRESLSLISSPCKAIPWAGRGTYPDSLRISVLPVLLEFTFTLAVLEFLFTTLSLAPPQRLVISRFARADIQKPQMVNRQNVNVTHQVSLNQISQVDSHI